MTFCFLIVFLALSFQEPAKDFDYYLEGFSRHSEVNPDSALYYARKMLHKAHENNDDYEVVRAEYALGYTYRYLNDYIPSINHYRNSLRIARIHGFEEREMMAANGLGMAMYRAGNHPEALRYLYKSLLIRENRANPDELSTIYNNIGLVYLKLYNWDKAYEYLTLAIDQKEKLGKSDAPTLVNLSICLPYLDRIEEAHNRFAQFREVCQDQCSPQLWCDYYNAMGGMYFYLDDFEASEVYFRKALELARRHELMAHQEIAYDNISMVEMLSGSLDRALAFADSALNLALELNMPQRVQNNYYQMAQLKSKKREYADALSFWNKYDSMRQQVSGEEVMNEIYGQELEWMKKTYEYELEEQQALTHAFRRTNIILIVLSIAVGLLAFLWWLNYKRKKGALLRLEETQTLLVRQEKLAALGSLMAGIAHELNSPLSAALASATSGMERAREIRAQSSDMFNGADNVIPELVTGTERRRLRKQLHSQMPKLQNKDELVENFLDLGIYSLEGKWNELISNCEHETEVMELVNSMLLERDLGRIHGSLQNMKNVVKSLQDSSRGGGEYALANVDLVKSLKGALILLHNQLKYDIKVVTEMPVQAVQVVANPQRLTQVWINLIVNAIQAMNSDEPTIWIRIDERMSNTIAVMIRDNGAGINAEDQPKIYDKFYTTRYAQSGNGMGLHIVKEIVGELNSTISFYSSDKGTEFCVFLPRA